jgi:hypothetical protein
MRLEWIQYKAKQHSMKLKYLPALASSLHGEPKPAFAQNWTPTGAPVYFEWQSVACSSDGSKLDGSGLRRRRWRWRPDLHIDELWCNLDENQRTYKLLLAIDYASSTDGAKLVAAVYQDDEDNPGAIYTSTNSGMTWKAPAAPTDFWICLASSADGTKLVAADSGAGDGLIYSSTNFGKTWQRDHSPK